MPNKPTKSGSELFIVDNSDSDWKVRNYLHDWADIAQRVFLRSAALTLTQITLYGASVVAMMPSITPTRMMALDVQEMS